MAKNTNKSIVCHGCESHAILRYDNAVVDFSEEGGELHSTSGVKSTTDESDEESEGKDEASVVGCNANNGNAGRTLNANNSVSNSNDNYAGGFAHRNNEASEEHLTSQPPRLKTDEEHIGNVGYVQDDYESLPFMVDDIAESDPPAGSLFFEFMLRHLEFPRFRGGPADPVGISGNGGGTGPARPERYGFFRILPGFFRTGFRQFGKRDGRGTAGQRQQDNGKKRPFHHRTVPPLSIVMPRRWNVGISRSSSLYLTGWQLEKIPLE